MPGCGLPCWLLGGGMQANGWGGVRGSLRGALCARAWGRGHWQGQEQCRGRGPASVLWPACWQARVMDEPPAPGVGGGDHAAPGALALRQPQKGCSQLSTIVIRQVQGRGPCSP